MSALLIDVIDGTIDHKQANAACNVADRLLKGVELEYRMNRNKSDKQRMIDYLSKEGKAKPAIIANDLNLPVSVVTEMCKEPEFKIQPEGIGLA